MDGKRIAELAKMSSYIGIGDMDTGSIDELQLFMSTLFGIKRLLIVRINHNKNHVVKKLESYSNEKELEICKLDGEKLTADSIKGEWKIIYENGMPYSERLKPYYASENKQMIIVDNLTEDTDVEVLRSFLYMGSLGSYYDDVKNLPKEKLPYGSAYVFMADDNFPLEKFASISSNWRDEAAVLDLRDFQTKVKDHLGVYKSKVLKISECGTYNYKNEEIPYKYILPKDKEQFNIIEKYRYDFFASDYSKSMTLHKYFHHLNSSQAMCINFFYPLIREQLLELIIDIIGIDGDVSYNPHDVCFEKESELEQNAKRKTNFDFYIKLNSGTKVYFEIKYSENDFGKAKHDDEHIKKFHETYMPLLKNNPAINDGFKEENIFLNNYQIMRNLIHIDKDSYVIFIYPEGNNAIREAALYARKEIIENSWKNHFIPLTLEELIKQLNYRLVSKELKDYYNKDFSDKYLKY